MRSVNSDNSQTINGTPFVRFIHITEGEKATGQAAFEGSIPDYLARCQTTVKLIKDAEEQGALKPGMEIIEPVFDSTGVALAYVAADRGYNLTLTVPESMSYDRRKILAALGANVILTSATEGRTGAIKRAEEIVSAEPQKCFLSRKFKRPASTESHTATSEVESGNDSAGIIHVSVSGAITGGSSVGVSCYTQQIKGKLFYSSKSAGTCVQH